MVKTLHALEAGTITPVEQDHTAATLAPILTREDGIIDFARPASTLYNRWRGFQPWPGAHTLLRGKKLIAHRMRIGTATHVEPGVLRIHNDEMHAGCGGDTTIVFDEVQMEGKRRMPAAEFLRGFQSVAAKGSALEAPLGT